MTQWVTVDWSDAPGGSPWKGRVFRAKDEAAARSLAHSFGYTVLRRENDDEDWTLARGWNSPEDEARWLERYWNEGAEE